MKFTIAICVMCAYCPSHAEPLLELVSAFFAGAAAYYVLEYLNDAIRGRDER